MRSLLLTVGLVSGCTGYHEEISGDCTGGWQAHQPTAEADGVWWGTDTSDGGGTAGASVAAAGDLDGDGNGEFLIMDSSVAYVVQGPGCGAHSLTKAHATLEPPRGDIWGDWLLHGVGTAGDLDGDGTDTMVVFAPESASVDPNGTGVALLFDAPEGKVRLDEFDAMVHGAEWTNLFWNGQGLVPGELSGDDKGDLAVGYAHFAAHLDSITSAVHLLHGPLTGHVDLSQHSAVTLTVSPHPTQPAGEVFHPKSSSLALADLTGSGLDSLVVPTWDEQVAVFLEPPQGGDLADAGLMLSPADGRLRGVDEDLPIHAADLDADGYEDLLIPWRTAASARDELGDSVLLRFSGAEVGQGSTASTGMVTCGTATCLFYGLHTGDFDGDGATDLLFDRTGDDEGPDQGIIMGPLSEGELDATSAQISLVPGQADPWMLSLSATDANGDGVEDVIFGVGRPEPGRAYLLLGGDWAGQ